MKTKSITYLAGETFNLGNYSSIKREISVTVEIQEGEVAEDEWKRLQEAVDNKLQVQLKKGGKK